MYVQRIQELHTSVALEVLCIFWLLACKQYRPHKMCHARTHTHTHTHRCKFTYTCTFVGSVYYTCTIHPYDTVQDSTFVQRIACILCVCVCVCVYACICVCTCAFVCIHMCAHTPVSLCVPEPQRDKHLSTPTN